MLPPHEVWVTEATVVPIGEPAEFPLMSLGRLFIVQLMIASKICLKKRLSENTNEMRNVTTQKANPLALISLIYQQHSNYHRCCEPFCILYNQAGKT